MNLNFDGVFSFSAISMLGVFGGLGFGLFAILNIIPSKSQQATTATFQEQVLNNCQIWALQNPHQQLSKILLLIASVVESPRASTLYLNSKRLAFGSNFCCAGQVVLGEFKTLETALTSPQARTLRLATVALDANHLPNQDVGGRNVFLLSLSDKEAGGNGDHESFRKCMQNYILNDAATQRQRDAIAVALLDKLAADYLDMPHDRDGKFFTDDRRGLKGFIVPYLHYVLFGLNPDDKQSMGLLTELHYTRLGTLYYFTGIGRLLQRLNLKGHGDLPDLIERVATIYENSPALASFKEDNPEYNSMTRRELAKLMISIMSIAGLQGTLHLGKTALGCTPLPPYQGQQTADIDLTLYWDKLDLEDRYSVRLYLLECIRLRPPVNASHRVATEPFTTTIAGKERTFPTGTKVLIPMGLGLLDESFWGATVYEFNSKRENLCPYHMGFHSVGDRSAGRICPGKDISLDMLVDVVITVGKARRSSYKPNSSVAVVRSNS